MGPRGVLARDITAVKDILTGDSGDKGVQTATTTLAMIEQGLKVFTAIYKRVYRAMQDEFKLLFILNSRHMEDKEYFTFLDSEASIAKTDYDVKSIDIMPVADPRMVTDMQKAGRANVIMQIQGHPVYGAIQDPVESLRMIYESVGMENTDNLIKPPQPNPMQDAMAVAEIKDKEAGAAQKAAAADKTKAETDAMTADRNAENFGAELQNMMAGVSMPQEAA